MADSFSVQMALSMIQQHRKAVISAAVMFTKDRDQGLHSKFEKELLVGQLAYRYSKFTHIVEPHPANDIFKVRVRRFNVADICKTRRVRGSLGFNSFKKKDYTKFPKIYLDGMKEWSIPQKSKFKVEQLPEILASVPFNTPYTWFDLVCIPQEPIDEQLIFISAQEIGRQAKIFRRAKIAAAWFNDVDTWKGMNAAISRLSINFLQEGKADDLLKSSQDPPGLNCDRNLEFFEDASEANEAPEDFMNRWFSSLWTLQEICLRPDMRLCNKNWEVLNASILIQPEIFCVNWGVL